MGKIVTIVGAGGKMGKWFFEYFNNIKNNSYPSEFFFDLYIDKIFLYDIKEINYALDCNNQNIVIACNIFESVRISDIVVFCTPVNEIISMINDNSTLFKSDSIIIEISSIKSDIHRILSDISTNRNNIVTLCLHPMFGPGASIFSKNKVIFIPVDKNKREIEEDILNKIFPSFERITIEDPDQHDLAISVIISLIYFINLVFSKFLVELSNSKELQGEGNDGNLMQFLKKISGSTFKIQSLLSESILTDDVSLFLTLFINNDKSFQTINKYRLLFNQLLDKIEKKDQDFLKKDILTTITNIKKDIDINKSYEMLYKFLNS